MESAILNVKDVIDSNRWGYDYNQVKYIDFNKKLEALSTVALQAICNQSITKGETPLWKGDKYVAEADGVLFIRSENIREYGLDLSNKTFIPHEVHRRMSRSQIEAGDVLLAIVGATIGQVTVVPDNISSANCNQAVAIVRPKPNINPYYLRAILQSNLGQIQIHRLSGGTARPNLDLWETRILRIPIVSRSVQDQIAQVMQDAYSDRQQKLDQSEQSYQKIIEYIFGELGISITSADRKRSALVPISILKGGRFDFEAVVTLQDISSQFVEHETTSLNNIVKQVNERTNPSEESPDQDINYIGLANIQSNTGGLASFSPVLGKEVLSSSPKFKKGDILYGRMRPYLNKVWIAEFDGVCSGEALVFRPNKTKVNSRFLHALLLSKITLDQVIPLQSGSSLPRVSAADVLSIKLPIPSDLPKQKKIGDEIKKRCKAAKQLRLEAEEVVVKAKAKVEKMILGEENDDCWNQ
jgi:type I restriction enzyme, S subunit